jgi:L-malate glycosyltransferase
MTGLAGLRVGLVGPLPPPAGGMAMQTRQLGELLAAAGAEVVLVPTNAPYRPAFIAGVPGLRAVFRLWPYLWALWRAAGRCDLLHVMANSGWSWHLFAAPAIWIARLRRTPVVVNYRGGEAAEFLRGSARVVRVSLLRAARLIVPSGFLQQVFGHHGMAAEIVPNIVDLARFHPAEGPPASPRLLVARNLEAIYDNETALRAFALVLQQHADARLTVAGTGPLAEPLRRLAASLGVAGSVHFAGRVERDAMAGLLRESSVALNPSLVDNTPNSVLEALASGVPVVSTQVGGVPFIVEDGRTALLVPPQDPQAMAAAVLRLLADPGLHQRLAAAGLVQVQQFTWGRVAPRLAAVYLAALQGHKG